MTYVSALPYSRESPPGRSTVTTSMKERMVGLHQRGVDGGKKIDVGTVDKQDKKAKWKTGR